MRNADGRHFDPSRAASAKKIRLAAQRFASASKNQEGGRSAERDFKA